MTGRRIVSRWVFLVFLTAGCRPNDPNLLELVNVSYDPTRELYKEINAAFERHYNSQTGQRVQVTQSHGGSGSQARAVMDGLEADVVTLALASDIDAIQEQGLIDAGWQDRLPQHACPFSSTIVLVVRKGNPKQVHDWPDLVRPGIGVITPNPKISGGARWNFLAAWAFVTLHQEKSEAAAREFIGKLFANVPKLDTGARASMSTFLRRKQGDVLIAWENEALMAAELLKDDHLQIIYPSSSIVAEPPVAWVDRNVDERGTRELAKQYLEFLYQEEAQEMAARHGFRPTSAAILEKHAERFPEMKLFNLRQIADDWEKAHKKFFADGGVFDQAFGP